MLMPRSHFILTSSLAPFSFIHVDVVDVVKKKKSGLEGDLEPQSCLTQAHDVALSLPCNQDSGAW